MRKRMMFISKGKGGREVICLPAPGILPKKTENIFIDRDCGLTKTFCIKVISIPCFFLIFTFVVNFLYLLFFHQLFHLFG